MGPLKPPEKRNGGTAINQPCHQENCGQNISPLLSPPPQNIIKQRLIHRDHEQLTATKILQNHRSVLINAVLIVFFNLVAGTSRLNSAHETTLKTCVILPRDLTHEFKQV